jgi:hypothetical protein
LELVVKGLSRVTTIVTELVEPQYRWENQTQVSPSLWVLQDFLTPAYFDVLCHEMRCTESLWSSRYGNRLVCESENWINTINFGASLIPKLNELTGCELAIASVRGYKDFSNSFFFKHFDSTEFIVNVQLYMIDFDEPSMGTQFCLDSEINQHCFDTFDSHRIEMDIPEDRYFTVPFKSNWGYINDNRDPKVHKTLPVPPGKIRESIHINYGVGGADRLGLENVVALSRSTEPFQQVMWHEWQERNSVTNTTEWLQQQRRQFEQQQIAKR